jgi:hypothetical protein
VGVDLLATLRRLTLAAGLAAAGVAATAVAVRAADPPTSPYGGKLAKALFLSDDVGQALTALGPMAPAAAKPLIGDAATRARAGGKPLVQGMVALVPSPEAKAESAAAAEALLASPPPVEDAQGIAIPLHRATLAEGYLKANRESALRPYLYAYLLVQYRLAFERQVAAKALDGQKASARKYRAFLLRARESTDPLITAVVDDIDAPYYLERPTADHPRDFDPDACCRNR